MKNRGKGCMCPFYGKNEDYCDVGCGYISPHDVTVIIRYCSARHTNCIKFRELADRYPGDVPCETVSPAHA